MREQRRVAEAEIAALERRLEDAETDRRRAVDAATEEAEARAAAAARRAAADADDALRAERASSRAEIAALAGTIEALEAKILP